MSMKRSLAFHNFRNLFLVVTRYRSRIDRPIPDYCPDVPAPKHSFGTEVNQGLQLLYADHEVQNSESATKITRTNANNFQQPTPSRPKPDYPSWTRWIFGAILTLVLPFWKEKLNKLLKLEEEVEMVAEVVENVAETVERVAVVTEKLSSEVADKIPGDGKLKKAALLIERASTEATKDARIAEDIIHKVEELKQDVETLIEPHVFDRENFAGKKI
ncbi:hypothetical protein BVC80_8359g6 [Macleaya cordata]|uniref:Uncharacterized protein n=1 Tax=Macleaya cordata TaxID=56857 RepID=A0A200QFK7_MACCD|nr:hypothetical protein BVC80_8359g6 [Macleaya cordata]